jgi:mycofactocin precursor
MAKARMEAPSAVVVARDSAGSRAPGEHADSADTSELVESDLLVGGVSIDGMCGVY